MLVNATTNTTSQTTITITNSTETGAVVDGSTPDFSPLMLESLMPCCSPHSDLPLYPGALSHSAERCTQGILPWSSLFWFQSPVRWEERCLCLPSVGHTSWQSWPSYTVWSAPRYWPLEPAHLQHQVLVRVSNSLKINSNILLTCKKRKKMKLSHVSFICKFII